jgi:serine/threonine protein phosphatase PrpC
MNDQFFGITDAGKKRQNNEDTFIAEFTADNKFIIACVIDGVGGYSGGEIAAAMAREAILQRLDKPSGEIIPMIIDCFNLANEKIIREKENSKEYASMACVSTLAIVDIERNQFYFAHVGDTRLYLVRDNSLVKISHDQSFVGYLEDSGRLSEAEAMKHPKRNEINKALGLDTQLGKEEDYIETGQSPFLPGDMLLLCSDGLTDMVDSAKIESIVTGDGSLKEKGQKLVDAANRGGGNDNITVVLVKNDKIRAQSDAGRATRIVKKNDDPIFNPGISGNKAPNNTAEPVVLTKVNKTPVVILSILCTLFLSAAVWQFLQNRPSKIEIQQPPHVAAAVIKLKNTQEIKLQQALNLLKGHTLLLSDTAYTSPVIISEALQVNTDTLVIKVLGKLVLQSDTGYNGSAFNLTSKCKYIVLDSLVFVNFKVAVTALNDVLTLKNSRFINCLLPMQNGFTLPGSKYISGKLPAAVFKADSIPVKTN